MDSLYHFIIVTALSSYFIRAWFNSTLAAQFFNIFRKKNNLLYTRDDVDNHLLNKSFFVYSLLTCPICLAWHSSFWLTVGLYALDSHQKQSMGNPYLYLSIFTVSALVSSFFGGLPKIMEKRPEVVEPTPKKKTKKPRVDKKEVEKKVQDFGGYLIEVGEDGKRTVIGMTQVYTDYISRVFDETQSCNFPHCREWREKYRMELEAIEANHTKEGKECPECIKSGLKRKFYDIIKDELESLRKNAKH